jgi:hypothetical protein
MTINYCRQFNCHDGSAFKPAKYLQQVVNQLAEKKSERVCQHMSQLCFGVKNSCIHLARHLFCLVVALLHTFQCFESMLYA